MEIPTLSIIIPVYNGALYLQETIESVLRQPCKDFELILLDDGSTDASLNICREYIHDINPKVAILAKKNEGVSITRNRGIELFRGKIIIFMDQDDAMKKDFYTETVRNNILDQFNKGVDLICPGRWQGNETLTKGRFEPVEIHKKGIVKGGDANESYVSYGPFHQNIFSRSLFFHADGTPTSVRFLPLKVDVETTFRHMTQYAARKILISDAFAFSVRRENRQSVSSRWDFAKVHFVRCDAYFQLIEWHKKYFQSDNIGGGITEKQFLHAVEYMIEDCCKNRGELQKLIEELRNQHYFGELQKLASVYPESSENFHLLFSNPSLLAKKYKVPLWRRIVRLRRLLINPLYRLKYDKDLSSVV